MYPPIHIQLETGKKLYFLSDFHLRDVECPPSTDEREKNIVNHISEMQKDAGAFFFLGDVFDKYLEYKRVTLKGVIRLQAKWLELKDNNIPVYFFRGNHDFWTKDYFEKYFGIHCFRDPQKFVCRGKTLLMAHGDGLGKMHWTTKTFQFLITNRLTVRIGRFLHPNLMYILADMFLRTRENQETLETPTYDHEWLLEYAKDYATNVDKEIDYFLFGHRHIPLLYKINERSTYINTGNWMSYAYSYAEFDGQEMKLHYKAKTPTTSA